MDLPSYMYSNVHNMCTVAVHVQCPQSNDMFYKWDILPTLFPPS